VERDDDPGDGREPVRRASVGEQNATRARLTSPPVPARSGMLMAKSATCLTCRPDSHEATEPAPASRAGGSAQREYERRKANDERRVRERHPHVGGLVLKMREEPQHLVHGRRAPR
jgi:hypothetical protein